MSNLSKAKINFLFWLIVGSISICLILIIYKTFSSVNDPVMPAVQAGLNVLQEKMDKSKEEVLIEKIKIKAEADNDKKELDKVLNIQDGEARRRALAELLSK